MNICEKCKYCNRNTKMCEFWRGPVFTHDMCCGFAVKTNADRIRAMSDEELAEMLCTVDFCEACEYERDNGTCHYIDFHPDGRLFDGCVQAALKWFQQPAEGAR